MTQERLETYAEAGRAVDAARRRLAETVTERTFARHPELLARYGERGRAHCLQDAEYHLSYLADSLAAGSPALFTDYVAWAKVMLAARGIPETDLADNLETLGEVLREGIDGGLGDLACEYVQPALRSLPRMPADLRTGIDAGEPLAGLAREYLDALVRGDRQTASRLVVGAVSQGRASVRDVYLHVFQRSQHEIGRLWQTNRLSVAQEHYCTAATQLIMSQLYPWLFATARNGRSLVATCVAGDLHEIGVRMVADFFELEGWDTFYLGANTPAASILRTLDERRADVLALSATMTFHVRAVAELVDAVRKAAGDSIKVLVGGYPFNVDPELWRRLGADGSARDAADAIALAGRLVAEEVP